MYYNPIRRKINLDFVLFFNDNFLHSTFDFYDTTTSLKLAIEKCDDDCFVCLSSVKGKTGAEIYLYSLSFVVL